MESASVEVMTRIIEKDGKFGGRLVGPKLRRPLDPSQDARNAEALLRVTDPESGKDTNLMQCTNSTSYYPPRHRRCLEFTGFIITKNKDLLKRLSTTDENFSWSVVSTFGFGGNFQGKLETVPDFSAADVTIRILA